MASGGKAAHGSQKSQAALTRAAIRNQNQRNRIDYILQPIASGDGQGNTQIHELRERIMDLCGFDTTDNEP